MITWDDFGCHSDVVQISFRISFRLPIGFKNLIYCSVTNLDTQKYVVIQIIKERREPHIINIVAK